MKPLFAAALVAAIPSITIAQEPDYTCPGTTQLEMNFCARDSWKVADDELNRLWRIVKPKADALGSGQALLGEQRAWLQRRDAACKPELDSNGSIAPLLYWTCMERQTQARNRQLRALQ